MIYIIFSFYNFLYDIERMDFLMDNINKKKILTQINSLKKAIDKEVKKGNISGSEYKDGYLHGSIRDKKIKCGKKNCKCANGIFK